MAREPQSNGQASPVVEGKATATSEFTPRGSDVVIAVMGVTGAGKSTFISKCVTGPATPVIGHDIKSCTQNVGVYECEYSPDIKVYLIDTPGFDDTMRSDKQVLQDIAFWLGKTYKQSIRLTGIIYFHRIIDPRMTASARKNLFMFKKLCGESALQNVILATTMWEKVDITDGERRESQLMSTPEFWGWMKEKGSQVRRHYNTRDSAMDLLHIFVEHSVDARTQVALDIQCEMVDAHKTLDQTGAGKMLDSALAAERDKFRRDIEELHAEWKEAMAARDSEAAEMIRNAQADMQRQIAELEHDRANLKLTLEAIEAQRGRVGNLEQMIADMKANSQALDDRVKQLATGRELGAAGQSIKNTPSNPATTHQHQPRLDEAEVNAETNHDNSLTSMFNLASTALRCGQFQQVQKLEEEVEYKVYSIAFSPDGQRLASGGSYQSSDNKGIIQIWEVDGQGQFQQIQKLEDDVGYKVYSIAFSPDNRRLASGGYYRSSNNTGRIQIWEVDGQGQFQQIQKFEDDIGYKVYSIAFSPDNRRLASGGYYRSSSNNTGRIQIWEVDGQGQFQQIQKFEDDVVYSAYSIAFSPDNRRLASGGSNLGNKGIIQIWETDGQGQFQQIQKLEDDVEFLVYSIAFSPDNRRLASGSSKLDTKGRIQIWNADSSV